MLTFDAPDQLGSLILVPDPDHDVQLDSGTSFAAAFDVLIGGVCGEDGAVPVVGCGAAGLSFSFGDGLDAAAPFGEEGAGNGLRVQLLTSGNADGGGGGSSAHDGRQRRLVVVYGKRTLATAALNETIRSWKVMQRLSVQYSTDGLWVNIGATQLISRLRIPDWAPRSSWRFGFGARTGNAWGARLPFRRQHRH